MTEEQFQAIYDLIELNLKGVPKIAPDKHREVEHALLNAIKVITANSIQPLARGSHHVGNVNYDYRAYITFPDVGTDQYFVLGSIQSHRADVGQIVYDNDVFWVWGNPTKIGFELSIREVTNDDQNITFWYMLLPKI